MIIDARALVVEDDNAIRRHLVRALARAVLHVDEARDGYEALEMFEKQAYPLVVLDLRLPRLDGMEVLRRIRAHNAHAQIIIMTGHGNKDDAVEALNLHAYKFFEKPLNIEDVEDSLRGAYRAYEDSFAAKEAETADDSLLSRINAMYATLAELAADDAAIGTSAYQDCIRELRALQEEEAREAQRTLRDSLGIKPGLADATLDLARKELGFAK